MLYLRLIKILNLLLIPFKQIFLPYYIIHRWIFFASNIMNDQLEIVKWIIIFFNPVFSFYYLLNLFIFFWNKSWCLFLLKNRFALINTYMTLFLPFWLEFFRLFLPFWLEFFKYHYTLFLFIYKKKLKIMSFHFFQNRTKSFQNTTIDGITCLSY